ncbi:Serine-protein kinase RsbW [bioreactor metagenome]|jgi:anti-sigma regulatory factor (Ser/Thr protein kinase)|uniref:Serine-protein kinase RsbW n=1 Tax=bioreactor metagenome TaxID=1076179 RepID=A0A645HF33_9ZZZZ
MHRLQISFYGQEGYRVIRHCVNEYIKQVLGPHCANMVIAFNEAVNNAIKYGGKSKKNTVTVKFHLLKGKRLVIRVKDTGAGFDTAQACQAAAVQPDEMLLEESGRGLLIMKAVADYVAYNKRGNEVLLMKKIPAVTE